MLTILLFVENADMIVKCPQKLSLYGKFVKRFTNDI